MRIAVAELREIRLPLLHPFETRHGRTTERRIILVRVESDDGVEGWGECVAPETAGYTSESTASAWSALEERFAPVIAGATFDHAAEADAILGPPSGHPMAKAAIESACWDLEAKARSIPLWQLLGGTQREVAAAVALGFQPTHEALFCRIEQELAAGYQRIKLKIEPGRDLDLVAAVRKRFPSITLSVDANGAYTLRDLELLRRLDAFGLAMIEQPLGAADVEGHAQLQREIRTPVCLDESIGSAAEARLAIDKVACRVVNLKMGRAGGLAEALRIERLCRERGIDLWCGGMLEAGIGRAHNVALSTLAGFTLPSEVSASGRYFAEDIIDPPVRVTTRGTVDASTHPGIGYTVKRGIIARLTLRSRLIRAS